MRVRPGHRGPGGTGALRGVPLSDGRLPGGADTGARLVDGTVRRPARPWTPTVHHLLGHLAARGFAGVPRALGVDGAEEVLTYLPGRTVGTARPWPAWVHGEAALDDIGAWLRDYHRAVADYVPPADARWREGGTWRPGLVVGHGDPAPYNAVWDDHGLVGLVDWDNAEPVTAADDLAWLAFSWTPLHARSVAEAEGFTAFGDRRDRLERLLRAYGWTATTPALLTRVDATLTRRIEAMRATAAAGDPAYRTMLERGQDHALEQARAALVELA